jgi:hypothetical protein
MPTNPDQPSHERQRSTDHGGIGQSGYTAGRVRDVALEREIHTQKVAVAYGEFDEEEALKGELGTDDRFRGF